MCVYLSRTSARPPAGAHTLSRTLISALSEFVYTCACTCEYVGEFSCVWFLALKSMRHIYQDAHTQLVPSDAALLRFSFALLALSPFLRTTPKELWRPGIGIGRPPPPPPPPPPIKLQSLSHFHTHKQYKHRDVCIHAHVRSWCQNVQVAFAVCRA